jgi:hypothetical protein
MKKTKILLLVVLLMISCLLNISAQEELPKYQALSIGEDLVKSSMIPEYEKAVKAQMSLAGELQFPYPVSTYSTNDFLYYYVIPLGATKYSMLDSIRKYTKITYSKSPEKWDAVSEKFEGTYDYYKELVILLNRELSYVPENQTLNQEEENFNYWVFLYVKVGNSTEFKEILKKWKELYKRNNINLGFSIYEGDIGTEQPLFIWHSTGKNKVDFWTEVDSHGKALGEEAKQLKDETRKLTRKIEIKTGLYRPELSYSPEKK